MSSWRPLLIVLIADCALSPLLFAQQNASQPAPNGVVASAPFTPAPPLVLQRDPQAVAILTSAVNAAGGSAALGAVQDYTATGSITYYWGSQGVNGSVTVKGRGTGEYRIDASLPEGVRTWTVSWGTGSIKEANGNVTPIDSDNTVNAGSLTLPFVYLVAALQDPNTSITYVGSEMQNGLQVQHIRLWKVFPPSLSQDPRANQLTVRDFYIDATTLLVDSSLDMWHPKNQSTVNLPHALQFSDYHVVNGMQIPFVITESVQSSPRSTIQLSQVTFNSGLSDSDFTY